MSDEEAYMALVLDNAQSELLPLEKGVHALHSKKYGKVTQAQYAAMTGDSDRQVQVRLEAARVALAFNINVEKEVQEKWTCLSIIHAAPEWLWEELVAMVSSKTPSDR